MVRLLVLLLLIALPAHAQDRAQDRDAPRLELILDPRAVAPFEGEMVLATLRGIYRQVITREEVKLRPMTDFDWVRLGQDRWKEERIDGRPARVFERRIAFYPRRAGALRILPVAHALEVLGPDGGRKTVTVRSAPVALNVRPKPATGTDRWLPLRALEISDSWDVDPARLADGQGATRRVVLRAFGATPERMPPQPDLRQPWLIVFAPPEERDFQVTPEGPVATVVWTWHLRPVTGEPGVIPAITLPWFDTGDRTARSATIPAAPIGYASFSASAGPRARPVGPPGWAFWGLAGLSALATAALATRGRSPAGRLAVRMGRRWRRRALEIRLRRQVRAGDAVGARRNAARLLDEFSTLDEAERLIRLRPADEVLFAGDAAAARAGRQTSLGALPASVLSGLTSNGDAAAEPPVRHVPAWRSGPPSSRQ
ncbi:hypothetical protein BYZ73_08200 [Rhodovulum viride]|uniref:Oxygen tolerance protein BatD n=1 Tax=Rhodovulum viride TaxID=1231134 RepID=A0ABX9DHS0_9RHOB|nr:BatD family protein [Rhodovulum viride]RAP41922.1 hypothetical protein BYZ73_08200 [Rhodovulum viride]